MINIRLSGGLGNQLFQIVCALRYSGNNPSKISLYSDDLEKYKVPREYELSKILALEFSSTNGFSSFILKYRLAKILKINKLLINDKNYYLGSIFEKPKLRFLDGYFQYEQNWEIIAPSVEFIKSKLNKNLSNIQTGGLVVHARGGDFLDDKASHAHQMKFYEQSLSGSKMPEFKAGVLCCSDPNYASEIINFFDSKGIFLSYKPNNDADWQADFRILMTAGFILGSRSTFAWWASLLGEVESIFPVDFTIGQARVLFHPWETAH
jgi:hypothetical protein